MGEVDFGECGTPRFEAVPSTDPVVEASKLVPGVQLIDLTDFYCTADRCPSVIGNVIVYRDSENTHITGTFASTLAPALEEQLQRILAHPAPPRP